MEKKSLKYILNNLLLIMTIAKLYRIKHGVDNSFDNLFLWVLLVIVAIWFPLKEGRMQEFKRLRHNSNPLFKKGHFRKPSKRPGGYHILSELKGLYIRDIYIIFLLVLLLIYSIYIKLTGRYVTNETIMFVWTSAAMIPHVCIVSYYENTLNKALKRKRGWGPFSFITMGSALAERLDFKYEFFNKFVEDFKATLKTNHYIYKSKYKLAENSNIRIFVRKNVVSAEVLGIIWIPEMNEEHHLLMDHVFEKFLFKDSELGKKAFPVYITYVVCVGTDNSFFWGMVNNPICQRGIRYRGLPVGISFESRLLYFPGYYNHWAGRTVKKMRKELYNMMELKD